MLQILREVISFHIREKILMREIIISLTSIDSKGILTKMT